MTAQEMKELLTGVITNLESPHPQQWSPSWIEKLKEMKESLARTHDAYYDDAEPLVDALEWIGDHASDFYAASDDFRFAKIYNKANEATGGTARFEIED